VIEVYGGEGKVKVKKKGKVKKLLPLFYYYLITNFKCIILRSKSTPSSTRDQKKAHCFWRQYSQKSGKLY
jgi:hypothetical protein